MSKVLTLTLTLLITQIILSFAGFQPEQTLVSNFFDIINHPEDVTFLSIFNSVSSVFTSIGIATISLGFFVSNKFPAFMLGGIAFFYTGFLADFASMIKYVAGKSVGDPIGYVIIIIYGTLLVMYLFSIVDWWRGTD